MPLAETLIFLVLGAVCGFVGGMFGVGGAVVGIPVLGLAFGLSEQFAQGTAFIMVLPNTAIGLWRYLRSGGLDLRRAMWVALAALPFSLLGARIATLLPSRPLRIAFAVFQLVLIAEYAWRSFRPKRKPALHLPWQYSILVGAASGLVGGLFVVGGALITVSSSTLLFGMTQLQAQGMALASLVPSTLAGAIVYAAAGDVDWAIAIPLAIGGMATVPLGVDFARRLPDKMLRLGYICFVLASGTALLVRAHRVG